MAQNDSNKTIELNVTNNKEDRERLQEYEAGMKASLEIKDQDPADDTIYRLLEIFLRMTKDQKQRYLKGLFLRANGKMTSEEVAHMTYHG